MPLSYALLTILLVHFSYSVNLIIASRQKRQNFDFSMNNGNNGEVNWEETATVPLVQDTHIIDSSILDVNGDGESGGNMKGQSSTGTSTTIGPTTTPTREANVPDFRTDCPTERNVCQYFSQPCPSYFECVMNLECSDIVCVLPHDLPAKAPKLEAAKENIYPTQTPKTSDHSFTDGGDDIKNDKTQSLTRGSLTGTKTNTTSTRDDTQFNFRSDCSFDMNLCLFFSHACPFDQECAMNLDCTDIVCVDYKNLQPTTAVGVTDDNHNTTQITNTSAPSNTVFTEHEKEEELTTKSQGERCGDNWFSTRCVHGHCDGDEYACKCDEGWFGPACDLPCTLKCVHGSCYVDRLENYVAPEDVTDDMMTCNCQYGWENPLCSVEVVDAAAEARKETMKIATSLIATIVFITGISIFAIFLMWRKRVIVVMKFVYFFKLQEDDDGRLYDAYISMGTSSKGIEFVKNQLCQNLENWGFNLYVPARDQLLSEAQSESVVNAMENSRRTILIITPEYLENMWSSFECFIAQIETLKLRQRIVTILLEDISEEKHKMNKTLKHILASTKCLKFPKPKEDPSMSLKDLELYKQRKQDRFWERLKLSMPKKKKVHESRNSIDSEMPDFDSKNVTPIDIKFTDMYSIV